jgi:putative ABC transport system substrate-binding protein
MRRREFITLVGGAAAWPLAARAQPRDRMRRIGILMGLPASDSEGQRWLNSFIQALRELGWRNGTNVQIDLRWTGDIDKMRTAAIELVSLQPDLIHVTTALATAEVLRQTRTIPVVFSVVNDPIALGFTQSSNATGFSNIAPELGRKWLELLKEIAPRITRAVMLFNPVPGSQSEDQLGQLGVIAKSLGTTIEPTPVRNIAEIEKTLEALGRDSQAGLIIVPDPFFNLTRSGLISSLASRYRVVAVYPARDFVSAGGLVSYAVDLPDLQRRAAGYSDRILRGETPSDLPMGTPNKFELVINLKSAKAIGLTVPSALLARASEVIE